MDNLNVIISAERYLELPWGLRRALGRKPTEADILDTCCYFLCDENDEYLPFDTALEKLWNATNDDVEMIMTSLKTQLEEAAKKAVPLASGAK